MEGWIISLSIPVISRLPDESSAKAMLLTVTFLASINAKIIAIKNYNKVEVSIEVQNIS